MIRSVGPAQDVDPPMAASRAACLGSSSRQSAVLRAGVVLRRLLEGAGACPKFPDPPLRSLLNRIAGQRELRFFLDGTKNLGHQSSTVWLMKRLIELVDYSGAITIVYADYGKALLGSTADKIALLLPYVDPRRLDRCIAAHHSCTDIRFVRYADRRSLSSPTEFGFSGGADDMSVNYARELNVRRFLRVQPYLWDDGAERKSDPYYESSRIEDPRDEPFYPVDACDEYRRLIHKPPRSRGAPVEPDVWNWYITGQSFAADLAVRVRNAKAVVEGCERDSAPLLWPLYGLQHFPDCASQIALNSAILALRAQETLRRAIALVSFSPIDGSAWSDTVRRLGADLSAGRCGFQHRNRRTRLRFIAGIDEASGSSLDVSRELSAALASASDDEVIFASVGPVPSAVYDRALCVAGLPSIIEGQTSSSYLISLGKPFLQIPRPQHLITNSYPARVASENFHRLSQQLNEAAARLRAAASNSRADELAGALSIIVESRRPQSEIALYFRRIARHLGADRRDKLLLGLRALAELTEGRPRKPPAAESRHA